MISERWRIERQSFRCDGEGDAHARYAIDIGGRHFTYVVRGFRWDGQEKVGRRADGAYRDMYSAIFVGTPDEARIEREIATFDSRNAYTMRTDAAVTGWAPANRSVRFFDYVVDALAEGRQPDPRMIGRGGGYILRNGGYNGSGRNGTASYEGFESDHPFHHPYFADLFALYLVRQVSIDLVDGIAAARNAHAAALAPDIARYIGIGNSSGQGMCVAMQRWPHWVATWMMVRELSVAYAKSMPIAAEPARAERLSKLLARASSYYGSVQLQCEDYVVPNNVVAGNLSTVRSWLIELLRNRRTEGLRWGDFAARVQRAFDAETLEQVNSLLVEVYPEFADAAAEYLPVGSNRERDFVPETRVGDLRRHLGARYQWALRYDLTRAGARHNFWYHSADNGEQRMGQRLVDPHEEFESFIDHIGLVQRLAAALATYDDDARVAEVIADEPELAFAVSRVQYLADVPYAEFRGNLIDREFVPAQLIRFMLAILGLECSNPLSTRYVRGVFFQGMPLAHEVAAGPGEDWLFPLPPVSAEREASVL